jgi:hypothetical protein
MKGQLPDQKGEKRASCMRRILGSLKVKSRKMRNEKKRLILKENRS